jgi:hypothetical protein
MEFILDNLGFVVFLALALVFRVIHARTKAAARREDPPRVFASALEPDNEEEDDEAEAYKKPDNGEGLIKYAQTRGASDYMMEKAREKMAPLAEEPPFFEALPGLPGNMTGRPAEAGLPVLPAQKNSAALAPAFPAAADLENVSHPAPGRQKKSGVLLPGLKKLTSLQQAVVWMEIMGKPRGMA